MNERDLLDAARGIEPTETHSMKETLATASAPFAWGTWIFSHIAQVNQLLQTLVFLTAIGASVAATWYHIKKGREIK